MDTLRTPLELLFQPCGSCVRLPRYGEAMDFDELLELIHILYNNLKDHPYKTKWHSATPMDNGTIAIGYTQYEPWAMERNLRHPLSSLRVHGRKIGALLGTKPQEL